MAVNTNFYTTLNALMSAVDSGIAVVDYDSFVDAGKKLADMQASDLANKFLNPLMNKVQKTILNVRQYNGVLTDMYAGTLNYGVLENILMDKFYSMDSSLFDGETLVDGQTYTDQFKVALPDVTAKYYTESDSFAKTITIRDTDLKGAFATPEKMDRFISGIMTQVTNSISFANESARLGTLARALKTADGFAAGAEDEDETKPAVRYDLVSIYNERFGTTLQSDEALYNDSFVRFAVATIRDISNLMAKPSTGFNTEGFQTWTPKEEQKLKVNALFDKAIRVSVIDAYNPSYGVIEDAYEVLPYWQTAKNRLAVGVDDDSAVASSPIIACLYDNRAMGEMLQLEENAVTRNELRRYTNFHFLMNRMYWNLDEANFVIFTLN